MNVLCYRKVVARHAMTSNTQIYTLYNVWFNRTVTNNTAYPSDRKFVLLALP